MNSTKCKLKYVVYLLMAAALIGNSSVQARGLPEFTGLVERHSPAVVNISTTQKVSSGMQMPHGLNIPDMPEGSPFGELFRHFFPEGNDGLREYDAKSLGSGFVISKDGYILTNYHVVKDADEIVVRLSDRRQLVAKVVGGDERSDIALLKVDADDLPVVKIGKSANLKVGEWVLAIGSPFGFDHSATAGIVSAKGRSLPRENYVPFIQTDVAINPGNSGGPLFNLDGEVVGVNSQIYSRTGGYMGLSFAIPIEVAMNVSNQLRTTGHVSRGWLGVMIQDVTRELAESFGMKKPQGALVAQVLADSPAKAGGVQVGDVILEFNDQDVMNSSNLPPIVGSSAVGERIKVKVMRDGKVKHLWVTLGELKDQDKTKLAATDEAPATVDANRLGLTVADLTGDQREELDVPKQGVLVNNVAAGAAADAGIRPQDVVLMLNNQAVKDAEHFNALVEKLPENSSVAILVQRRSGPIFLALKVPKE